MIVRDTQRKFSTGSLSQIILYRPCPLNEISSVVALQAMVYAGQIFSGIVLVRSSLALLQRVSIFQ